MIHFFKKIKANLAYTNFSNMLFAILIFTIPSNLFFTFLERTAYVRGLQIDYLIPKIYLSDFILLALFITILIHKKNRAVIQQLLKKVQKKYLLIVLFLIFIYIQFTVTHPLISLLLILRITAISFIFTILLHNRYRFNPKYVYFAISTTVLFQSLLAWYQFTYQKSFLGYYFLGETNINSYAGIAKNSLFGIQKSLPYGTTAHPNILAGIFLVFVLFLMQQKFKDYISTKLNIGIIILAISTILLTQSISAILGLCIGALSILLLHSNFTKKLHFLSNVKVNLNQLLLLLCTASITVIILLNFITHTTFKKNSSITRRANLNSAAITMFLAHPIQGVGLLNFTAQLEKYSKNPEIVRFIQPAHNVLALFLAEVGLLGFVCIATILYPSIKKRTIMTHPEYFLALLPVALLDHYLITIQSGILLLFVATILTHEMS